LGKDILGSIRSVSNSQAGLEDRYEYDAFGKPYKGDLENGMSLGYTGKPYDSATGMYDYGYRDYKPENARFTTVDPVRDGANWFAYVNNDPVNYLDPFGLTSSEKNGGGISASKTASLVDIAVTFAIGLGQDPFGQLGKAATGVGYAAVVADGIQTAKTGNVGRGAYDAITGVVSIGAGVAFGGAVTYSLTASTLGTATPAAVGLGWVAGTAAAGFASSIFDIVGDFFFGEN
jgi:RHS repeat-associated protein